MTKTFRHVQHLHHPSNRSFPTPPTELRILELEAGNETSLTKEKDDLFRASRDQAMNLGLGIESGSFQE